MTFFHRIREKIDALEIVSIERMRFAAIVLGVLVFGVAMRGIAFSSGTQKGVLAAAQPALVAETMSPVQEANASSTDPVSEQKHDIHSDEAVLTEDDAAPLAAASSTEPVAEIQPPRAAVLNIRTTTVSTEHSSRALLADAYIVARGAMPMEVLDGKNVHERRAPASLTKLMMATIVAEQIPNDEIVTITEHAVATEGVAGRFRAGERFYARDLMKAMLIVSSNDAAVAFADHVAEQGDDLIARMNAKAQELGMRDTHFANPSGLDDAEHYSSAFDLALLAEYSLRHEKIWGALSEKEDTVYSIQEKRPHTLVSNNPIIQQQMRGVKGSKTGYTANASGCMIVAMDSGEVIVVLGSKDRARDAEQLMHIVRGTH